MAPDLIQRTVVLQRRLSDVGISSAVAGDLAVAVWGEPRSRSYTTSELLVGRADRDRLLTALGARYCAVEGDEEDFMRRLGWVRVVDETGARFTLMVANNTIDADVVRRARSVAVGADQTLLVCSPEDLIVGKLVSTLTSAHEDAIGVVIRQGDALDDDYVVDWLEHCDGAFDDSNLVETYQAMRRRSGTVA
jgi:hypothetical protein